MTLIIHPEVTSLKDQLAQLILQYDNLISHVGPEIERQYVLKFGILEYELYNLELKIDKLKRKLQLIQIEINHGNEIDLDKIERILQEEFEEYEKQVQAQIDEIKSLEENTPEKLSESDTKKLKKLYRMLVKKLHPDLNPNQTFFELNLFYRAVYCFEHGDLKGLESVAAILPENAGEETTQIDDLKRLVQEYEDKVMELKKKYPFNKKELLEDDESGQKYKNMLNELIEDRKEDILELENKINDLI
ncbi:hypothetical protein [uncultured Methanobrevibacter sp.]|uniref:hypothetical protein n=1 Tax=uncultured Methanobrevibacter sp. TaxID=253161 RepID=UPI0025D41918|nr:hypothetical protein [uncultured Methanobrevibacter sp.]